MRKSIFLSMLGIAAMLASCSSEEDLQNVTGNDLSTVTITAQLENGIKTRATYDADDDVKRCIVEVRETGSTTAGTQYQGTQENGAYKFSLALKNGTNYDFLFWADDNSSYSTDDLTAVTLNTGKLPGIAFSGALLNTPLSTGMSVNLTHAVAKVTLKTTGTLETGKTVKVSIPTYAGFDVKDGSATGSHSAQDFTANYSTKVNNGEVFSFYVLAAKDNGLVDATVSCDGESTTLTYVPLQMNYRTVLAGDVAAIGKTTGDITATINSDWAGTNETQTFPQINLQEGETLTDDMIAEAIHDGELVIKGNLTSNDLTTLSNYLKANPSAVSKTLDMGDCTVTAIPAEFIQVDNGGYLAEFTITKLVLPQGTVSIGDDAFRVTGITTLALPETLQSIGARAFQYGSLTALTIPASVTYIGTQAFFYNNDLSSVTFKSATPPRVASAPFTGGAKIYVPSGSKAAYVTAGFSESRIEEYIPN